jgi:poly(A) polymerase
LADWWQEFSMASDSEREDLVQAAKAEQQALQTPKPRVRRAPRPDGAVAAPKATAAAAPEAETDDAGAPKKRRRRRRSAGAGGAGGESGSAE